MIQSSGLLIKERKLAMQGNLATVLVHDLLLNKGGIVANAGPFKDAVHRHKTRLQAEWIKAKIKLKVKDNTALAKVDATFIPRWVRVNTIKMTREEMMQGLLGFRVVRSLQDLQLDCVYVDEHIDNLLAFHPQIQLTQNKFYLDGSMIFQNKASCIPAAILDPPPGSAVIDACAAPGNKTSHLAALLRNEGTLLAFERDNRRVVVLREMMTKSGAVVQVTHGDFTRTDPHDPRFADVTHLLLDPSCSGSGIVNRLDYLTTSTSSTTSSSASPIPDPADHGGAENETIVPEQDRDRLDSLSSFQLALLLHAMKFPAARRITYSTCSIHAVENEGVVMAALRKAGPAWRVAPRSDALPRWPHRGLLESCDGDRDVAEGLVRAEPGALGTIGFFVACFVRTDHPTTGGPPLETSSTCRLKGTFSGKRKRSAEDDPLFAPELDVDTSSSDRDLHDDAEPSDTCKKKKKKKKGKKRKERNKNKKVEKDGEHLPVQSNGPSVVDKLVFSPS